MDIKNNGFKTGDVVRLKSGGPEMTVSVTERADGDVGCVWFADTEKKTALFLPDTLCLSNEKIKKRII